MNRTVNLDWDLMATIGGGFFAGILIGYAIKKVIKIASVIVGLFFAVLAYLQFQQFVNINWNKLQAVSENALTTQIPGFNNGDHIAATSNLGIPLTGGMLIGFTIGFLKGQYFADGTNSTMAGMIDYLFANGPRYLLVDEIDKMSPKDQAFLLNLIETGIVTETKYGKTMLAQIKTSVFATSNTIKNMSAPL